MSESERERGRGSERERERERATAHRQMSDLECGTGYVVGVG